MPTRAQNACLTASPEYKTAMKQARSMAIAAGKKPLKPETVLGQLTRPIEQVTSKAPNISDKIRLSGAEQLATVLKTFHRIYK